MKKYRVRKFSFLYFLKYISFAAMLIAGAYSWMLLSFLMVGAI